MYIEDELPRLEYGDAICKVGNKYVTDFIIFRLEDRKQTEDISASMVNVLADKFEAILKEAEGKISTVDFTAMISVQADSGISLFRICSGARYAM